jgi:hypothetical protein
MHVTYEDLGDGRFRHTMFPRKDVNGKTVEELHSRFSRRDAEPPRN